MRELNRGPTLYSQDLAHDRSGSFYFYPRARGAGKDSVVESSRSPRSGGIETGCPHVYRNLQAFGPFQNKWSVFPTDR